MKNTNFEVMTAQDVVHLSQENHSRPGDPTTNPFAGEGQKLVDSFVRFGWSHQGFGIIHGEKVEKNMRSDFMGHSELIAKWHEELEAKRTRIEAEYKGLGEGEKKLIYEAYLRIFDATYRPGGKWHTPKVGKYVYAATGHQRIDKALWAAAKRQVGVDLSSGDKLGMSEQVTKDSPYDDILMNIPVMFVTFKDEMERYEFQVHENEHDQTGKTKISFRDEIMIGMHLLAKGYNQNRIRNTFNPSKGQKIYGWLMLDSAFPKLRLLERSLYFPDAEGNYPKDRIPYKTIKGPKLPELVTRSDKNLLDAHNAKEREKQRKGQENVNILRPLTAEELEQTIQWDHLKNPDYKPEGVEDEDPQAKSMDAETFKNVSVGSRNSFLKQVQSAHANDDVDGLNKLLELTPILNLIHELDEKWGGKVVDDQGNLRGGYAALRDCLQYCTELDEESAIAYLAAEETVS